jgi:hypothetical protein
MTDTEYYDNRQIDKRRRRNGRHGEKMQKARGRVVVAVAIHSVNECETVVIFALLMEYHRLSVVRCSTKTYANLVAVCSCEGKSQRKNIVIQSTLYRYVKKKSHSKKVPSDGELDALLMTGLDTTRRKYAKIKPSNFSQIF